MRKSRSKRTTKKVKRTTKRKTVVRKSTRKLKATTKRKTTIRKSTKRVIKKPASRRKSKPEYSMEPVAIQVPKAKKDSGRTKAILVCPKCKSGNIRVVDYIGTKCVVCRDCMFDERNIYDVTYEERKAPKVKAVFKTGGHLRTRKRP